MTLDHYLRPLVAPSSVALIGASERPGSLGRIVYENILAGGFQGEIFAVNPNHKRVLGRRALRSLAALKKPVELAVIATPCEHVSRVLAEGGAAGLKAAVILTAPPPTTAAAQQWEREIARVAAKYRIRFLGTAAFGVIRTDLGLNATMGSVQALPGRLALIAQSGAVCSALRAAARVKPVVVLKSGRSSSPRDPFGPSADTVFDAALKRAGTVRVRSYTQLFSAARIIAMGRIARGARLAVVTNGRGPGLMAADSAEASEPEPVKVVLELT